MKDPCTTYAAAATTPTSEMDALTATLCNSIQALGRGFDVTADIRLLYCKGTPGSRLVQLDDASTRDLHLSDGVVVPNVPDHVHCSSDTRATENVPVCSFHKASLELFFQSLLVFAFLSSTLFVPCSISLPELLMNQFSLSPLSPLITSDT
ncbi:MACPF domain-containing protein CAD1, partial [Cucurbita argyrosperma subsp. sororia]